MWKCGFAWSKFNVLIKFGLFVINVCLSKIVLTWWALLELSMIELVKDLVNNLFRNILPYGPTADIGLIFWNSIWLPVLLPILT